MGSHIPLSVYRASESVCSVCTPFDFPSKHICSVLIFDAVKEDLYIWAVDTARLNLHLFFLLSLLLESNTGLLQLTMNRDRAVTWSQSRWILY